MTEDRKYYEEKQHNATLENRENLTLSGVTDVSEFNENIIIVSTSMGVLTVCGDNLKIDMLSVETGDMKIKGEIDKIEYGDEELHSEGGFWSRIFR